MSILNRFKLAKLTIEAFEDVERRKPVKGLRGASSLEVMYNPETLGTRHESEISRKQGIKIQGASPKWTHTRSKDLSVKLVFDGTHVSEYGFRRPFAPPSVGERVKAFLSLCYDVQSDSHEAAYLRLQWNRGVFGDDGFECRLAAVDIEYTLFDRDGAPLRAELKARFVEALDPAKQSARLRLSSPDLSHHRVVREGDTLPLLCREIYGSAAHYLRVAQVNGLDDFRDLRPGQALIFPPFERRGRD